VTKFNFNGPFKGVFAGNFQDLAGGGGSLDSGYWWSSSQAPDGAYFVYDLYVESSSIYNDFANRYREMSVRCLLQ
jgi:hypothetical protein